MLQAQGSPAWFCDLRDEARVAQTIDAVGDRFGAIDVLVNNAGAFPHYDTWAVPPSGWDTIMALNVRAVYMVTACVVPRMTRGGSINMSSGAALPTVPGTAGHDGLFAYAVSKAGVDRMKVTWPLNSRPSASL
jgi:NAD(P)-dependent dehydrogenase (short-subunit alcohol dehydrogenase family)